MALIRFAAILKLTDDVAYALQQAIDQPAGQLVRVQKRDDEYEHDQHIESEPKYGACLLPRTWDHCLLVLLFKGYKSGLAGDAAHALPKGVLLGQAGGTALAAGKRVDGLSAREEWRRPLRFPHLVAEHDLGA